MYRQNLLKQELDKLRKDNDYLKYSNALLNERISMLQTEIRALRLELQNKELVNKLTMDIATKPIKIEDFNLD